MLGGSSLGVGSTFVGLVVKREGIGIFIKEWKTVMEALNTRLPFKCNLDMVFHELKT